MSWEELAARWGKPEDFILWVVKNNDKPENPITRRRALIIGENMANEEYLGDLCDYTGDGFDLPTGGRCKVVKAGKPWGPEMLAYRWLVEDAKSEEGSKLVEEPTEDDVIIGVILNPKTIAAEIANWGPTFFMIKDANGVEMTLDEWKAKFGTDGLGLVAIRNKRKEIMGGGIHF